MVAHLLKRYYTDVIGNVKAQGCTWEGLGVRDTPEDEPKTVTQGGQRDPGVSEDRLRLEGSTEGEDRVL